ncbi:hypothetical protein [Anaerolentibacter hominis]|uniref:hypothetical protein n=1 Tax=Anaerolentibacter hominis TaxID=3079009 RepID=UPI0031B8823B
MLANAGVLLVYLMALKDEETGLISVRAVHSLKDYLKDFPEGIAALKEDAGDLDLEDMLEIYCILGTQQQTGDIMEQIRIVQRDIFQQILENPEFDFQSAILYKLDEQKKNQTIAVHMAWLIAYHTFCLGHLYSPQQFEFQRGNQSLSVCCLGMGIEYADARLPWMERAVQIWLSREAPCLYGKQVMIKSFLLNELKGRRIIGVLPEPEGDDFYLLMEGGRKLRLNAGEDAYPGEQFGYKDTGIFSINDISTIIQNPIYAYGIYYQPYEIFESWQSVFQYVIAVSDVEWTREKLQPVYETFLYFMEEQICDCMHAPEIITKEKFMDVYLCRIEELRGYLRCKEEEILSKDWLQAITNHAVYFEKMYTLLKGDYPEEVSSVTRTKKFELSEFRNLLDKAEEGTAYEKGIAWENAAAYMLERIPGLKLNGRRVRVARQEIDLCCINVSTDKKLWNLGALILAECKNWNRKADIKVIRNIGQIMQVKGTTTTLLFSKKGLTSEAEAERRLLALRGSYVLCLTKEDLAGVVKKEDYYDLLIDKWDELLESVEDNLAMFG